MTSVTAITSGMIQAANESEKPVFADELSKKTLERFVELGDRALGYLNDLLRVARQLHGCGVRADRDFADRLRFGVDRVQEVAVGDLGLVGDVALVIDVGHEQYESNAHDPQHVLEKLDEQMNSSGTRPISGSAARGFAVP